MTWQKIESAPMDGTIIDLWMVGPRSPEGYREADCWFDTIEWVQEYGTYGPVKAGYMIGDEPTHWMNRPEGPK